MVLHPLILPIFLSEGNLKNTISHDVTTAVTEKENQENGKI